MEEFLQLINYTENARSTISQRLKGKQIKCSNYITFVVFFHLYKINAKLDPLETLVRVFSECFC